MTNKQQQCEQTMLNIQDLNRLNGTNASMLSRVFTKLGDIIIATKSNKSLNNRGIKVEHVKGHGTRPTLPPRQIDFLSLLKDVEDEDDDGPISSEQLVQLIEMTLLEAKSQELGSVEVLVPASLTARVADDIMQLARNEPCGMRGGTVYLEYADSAVGVLSLGRFRVDNAAPATFDIVLTLRPDQASWLRPALSVKGYLKKRRNALVVVSSGYALAKNRLYRNEESAETIT